MSKYKVGDKVVLTVTSTNEMGCLPCYVLNDDLILSRQDIDKYSEPLSTYTEPLEAKIRRQAAEITRLLAENKELKAKYDVLKTSWDDYEEKVNDTCNTARAEGQNEAWELARKIILPQSQGGMNDDDYVAIFGSCSAKAYIMKNYTYSEAAAKVAEWEKVKEEFKVGDIYRSRVGNYFVIRTIDREKGTVEILWKDLSSGIVTLDFIKSHCTNTDRRIDIDSISQQIGGNGNER